jgi:hypothetical protein
MSNETQKPNPILTSADSAPIEGEVVEPKPGVLARTKRFLKDHKRPAIAVGALVGLVGLAAVAGRNTTVKHDFNATLELEKAPSEEEVEETTDTTVA